MISCIRRRFIWLANYEACFIKQNCRIQQSSDKFDFFLSLVFWLTHSIFFLLSHVANIKVWSKKPININRVQRDVMTSSVTFWYPYFLLGNSQQENLLYPLSLSISIERITSWRTRISFVFSIKTIFPHFPSLVATLLNWKD